LSIPWHLAARPRSAVLETELIAVGRPHIVSMRSIRDFRGRLMRGHE